MIRVRCEHCGQGFPVADEATGQDVRCPQCHNAVTVPPPTTFVYHPSFDTLESNLRVIKWAAVAIAVMLLSLLAFGVAVRGVHL
jgi:phage FluMu protein Com